MSLMSSRITTLLVDMGGVMTRGTYMRRHVLCICKKYGGQYDSMYEPIEGALDQLDSGKIGISECAKLYSRIVGCTVTSQDLRNIEKKSLGEIASFLD